MAALERKWQFPLVGTDNMGGVAEKNPNRVDASVERDKDRKVIRFYFRAAHYDNGLVTFNIFGGVYGSLKLADSLTHSPKAFNVIADDVEHQLVWRRGGCWSLLVDTLAARGLRIDDAPKFSAINAPQGWSHVEGETPEQGLQAAGLLLPAGRD